MNDNGYDFADNAAMDLVLKHPQIIGVPKDLIIEFLRSYKSHYLNMEFRTSDITGLLSRYTDGTVDKWDVMIANGTSEPIDFCNMVIKPLKRVFAIKHESGALQMSGKGARLGNANLAKGGLTRKECDSIEEAARQLRPSTDAEKSFSQEEYFNTGLMRRPLLVIYPVQLSAQTKAKDGKLYEDSAKKAIIDEYENVLIGLSIGIPSINGRKKETYQYRINLVKWREMLDIDDDYMEETGSEE